MKQTQTRTWAEIDLSNLEHNYRALRAMLPQGCRFLGVVKADATVTVRCRWPKNWRSWARNTWR